MQTKVRTGCCYEIQMNTLSDMVYCHAQDAVDKVLLDDVARDREELIAALAPKLGTRTANELDNYILDLTVEVAKVAALIGFALASHPTLTGSCEDWIDRAIRESGLSSFKPYVHPPTIA